MFSRESLTLAVALGDEYNVDSIILVKVNDGNGTPIVPFAVVEVYIGPWVETLAEFLEYELKKPL